MPRRRIPAFIPAGLLDSNDASVLLGISRRTLSRYLKEPDFPAPVQTGKRGRSHLFRREELLAWKATREAAERTRAKL